MKPIRILIADDHPVFRFGMRALLESEAGFEVVVEASTGDEMVALTDELAPDVVLMDISMPGSDGIEATWHILDRHPQTGVLIVTMLDDDSLFPAMRAGARGYLLKVAEGDETLRAIRAVAHGEAIFSPSIADRLTQVIAAPPSGEGGSPLPRTDRAGTRNLGFDCTGFFECRNCQSVDIESKKPSVTMFRISSINCKYQTGFRLPCALVMLDWEKRMQIENEKL